MDHAPSSRGLHPLICNGLSGKRSRTMKPVKSILMKVGLMKKWQIGIGALTLLVALALVVLLAPPASAHETREVGDYALVFGWQVEPAYVGVYNGPELTIRDL